MTDAAAPGDALAPAHLGEVPPVPGRDLATRAVHPAGHNGVVPDPEDSGLPSVPHVKAIELGGRDANLIIRILEEWVENRNRLLGRSNKYFMSTEKLREVGKLEREIGR